MTVTISSANMQGTRTTVTGDGGGYSFNSIPPGDYAVRFELSGMQSTSRRVQIGVGQSGRADATLSVAAVAEAITVTAADRGQFRLDDISSTDIALNYRYPIAGFELFAQGDVLNAFDRQTATIVSTSLTTNGNTPTTTLADGTRVQAFRAFNPFTDAPVECPQGTAAAACYAMGAHWQKGAAFGTPTSATASTPGNAFTSNFQVARTYRFSVGVRF